MHAIFLMATPSREDDSRKMLVSISPVRLVNIKLSLGLAGSRHKWDESFIKTGSKWILDIYKGWVTQFQDNKKCAVTAGTPPPPTPKEDSGLVANKLLLACVSVLRFIQNHYRSTHPAGGQSWQKVNCTSETAANQSHPPPPGWNHTD